MEGDPSTAADIPTRTPGSLSKGPRNAPETLSHSHPRTSDVLGCRAEIGMQDTVVDIAACKWGVSWLTLVDCVAGNTLDPSWRNIVYSSPFGQA
jgi:hypothetical protein